MKIENNITWMAAAAGWLLTMAAHPLCAEPWPQWRGPAFNGSSPETGLPSSWSKTENLAWSAPLPGWAGSTPIIWEDHVFVTSPDDQKNLLLLCFDRSNGSLRWKRAVAVGDRVAGKNNMSAPSPVTDGKKVVAFFATGDLAAFDFEGKELWHRNLGKEFGRFAHMWIYGSSPLLFEGKLYVPVLQRETAAGYAHATDDKPNRESFLLCINPESGRDLWRRLRETDAVKESREAYTTPLPRRTALGWEIILVGGDYVTGHDKDTGTEIWRSAGLNPRQTDFQRNWFRVVPSPIMVGDLVVACGPKNQPVFAVKTGGKGNVTESHRAWSFRDVTSDWSTPLCYRDRLYVLDGGKRVLACLDPQSGKKIWAENLGVPDSIWSSPTGADGKIYCLSERGTVVVLAAGDDFNILGKVSLGEEGPCRSSVAVSHGQLFIRTAKTLYCVGLKPK
jgi:outer membrane protein assembly factor BamB